VIDSVNKNYIHKTWLTRYKKTDEGRRFFTARSVGAAGVADAAVGNSGDQTGEGEEGDNGGGGEDIQFLKPPAPTTSPSSSNCPSFSSSGGTGAQNGQWEEQLVQQLNLL
jgi:hypothetical protein